ncbi:hypothetical protein LV82_00209 [Albidovulum inexpectatum]|uniref:Glycosyl transferase family 1 n=1 Tax=Albidovulum inexpectatum TaxID=196587 RepID=A0A2S5JLH4_9RHOB|nr:hypothetical protein [Albidovulum inexpectatum]PPB82282.1 hypothetical protein LV82_00209 [Albidovulum inexpectatum]
MLQRAMAQGPARQTRIAYAIDPRFPGGTSSAVAAELGAVAGMASVRVHPVHSRMFRDRPVSPRLAECLASLGIALAAEGETIRGDLVILHNPACLKFQDQAGFQIIARHLVVVTHENFLRPGDAPSFDVAKCLGQIDRASLCARKSLAPISAVNRASIQSWARTNDLPAGWDLLPEDWFNICDAPLRPATDRPRDRRGRHSRPGLEKFPPLRDLELCFPAHAESNVILGADLLMRLPELPTHWRLYPFGGLDLSRYFEMIDFLPYFTSPMWRESYGRVLAEGVAAGKVVLSDPQTAMTFQGAVVATTPAGVDGIIARMIADPGLYRAQVAEGQEIIARHGAGQFRALLERLFPDLFPTRLERVS